MATYTVHQAKSELSRLMARAEAGEEVVIARRNKPAVRLVPIEAEAPASREPGALKGMFSIPESFFDPLPDDELDAWEGKYSEAPGE